MAARLLAEGGSLVCYAGHHAMFQAWPRLAEHLTYRWCFSVRHSGGRGAMHGYEVRVGWKPLLWFTKGRAKRTRDNYLIDLLDSEPGDKSKHEWAQGVAEAVYLIENLTVPGELVIDPMCGSGTAVAAALRLGRKAIGVEIDPARATIAQKTIAA